MRLHGRDGELRRLRELLDGAADGRSAALLLHGEAGIGKTALLDAAADLAGDDVRVLRARGYEAEANLAFAGLADLLAPVLELRARIPPAQRQALGSALLLDAPAPYDRFAVPAGVLSLLGAAAEDGPLLAIVDDLQWVDEASREALLFAARRLEAEGVVLLLAARDDPDPVPAPGVERLRVAGLDAASARALLDERGAALAEPVAERLVRTASGNPLALRELPAALSREQLAGLEPLPSPLPPGAGIESAFARQIDALPARAREALVVAAAIDGGAPATLFAALARLGLADDALAPAERAQLLDVRTDRVAFRHPLLRSTAYHAATGTERLRVHAALAAVADDQRRRAWHLGLATVAPDEEVAAALEAAGDDARARGGHAGAASALERAADLSVDARARVRRRLAAAVEHATAGHLERAAALAAEVEAEADDPATLAATRRLRGQVEMQRGAPLAAFEVLRREGERWERDDPSLAAALLLDASVAHMASGDLEALRATAQRAAALAGPGDEQVAAVADLLVGEALAALGRSAEADALLEASTPFVLAAGPRLPLVEMGAMAGHSSIWLERFDRAERILAAFVDHARASSALGRLVYPLTATSHLSLRRGQPQLAYAQAGEAVRLARETGQMNHLAHALGALAEVQVALGHVADGEASARESLELCEALGMTGVLPYATAGLGWAAFADGRVEEAVGWFERAARAMADCGCAELELVQFWPDLVEALLRVGRVDEARERLAELRAYGEPRGRPWVLAVAARCEGLLADDDGFEASFDAALRHHEAAGHPLAEARTLLAYGERLRRARRKAAAREPLTRAHEAFGRMGCRGWAERARAELAATGGAPRPRAVEAADDFTPQEAQIAELVAQGLTNREVAAQLFLSPKTIEYHLRSIFRKAGVRSRVELARRAAAA